MTEATTTWHAVANAADIEDGDALRVMVGPQPVAVYNLNGTFYATHDVCTHAQASLADGYVDGDCVECPLHEGVFHIPTGKVVSGPVHVALRVFAVKVEHDTIWVQG
jgi:nitrite reductase/ring-hydroxylating ferredoxin subunit